jgi:hypothetical protein
MLGFCTTCLALYNMLGVCTTCCAAVKHAWRWLHNVHERSGMIQVVISQTHMLVSEAVLTAAEWTL